MSDATNADCVFCRIVRGELPASIVYENEDVLAFMDLHPMNPGHVLVIPKEHFAQLADLPETVGAQLFTVAQRLAAAIRQSSVRCEGVNLHLADGVAAGQDVFHSHLHVRPRFTGDSVRTIADYGQPSREELDAIAQRIRAAHETMSARREVLADDRSGSPIARLDPHPVADRSRCAVYARGGK